MNVSRAWRNLQISQVEFGKILGLSQSQVSRLNEIDTFAKDKNGKILLVQSLQKYYALKQEETEQKEVSFDKEHALLERAKREKAELELGEMRNDLHKTDDIMLLVGGMVVEFRQRLLSIPSKMATTLVGKSQEEIQEILTKEIHLALTDLSQLKGKDLVRQYDADEEERDDE